MKDHVPNLFTFATSELSQDAMLAYWLSWAKPDLADHHLANHTVARNLLDRLFEKREKPTEEDLKLLKVTRQHHHIDVAVEVGNSAFIIIEDKINTREHSKQLERYEKTVLTQKKPNGEQWKKGEIIVVYVKTGNESKKYLPDLKGVEYISRLNLLNIIEAEASNADDVFRQYYSHLKNQQYQTEKFGKIRVSEWDWPAIQGFYMKLEAYLDKEECMHDYEGWSYVPNQSGGFMGFFWYERSFSLLNCYVYLQLIGKDSLQVRVSTVKDDSGKPIKSSARHRYQLIKFIEDKTLDESHCFKDEIKICKSGRYQPGFTGGIAELSRKDNGKYYATNSDGTLDFEETVRFLKLAMSLIDKFSNKT